MVVMCASGTVVVMHGDGSVGVLMRFSMVVTRCGVGWVFGWVCMKSGSGWVGD